MKLKELIVLLHVILIWAGCTESAVEPLSGCTNCNAINFDNGANEDDGSCIFINTNRLGDYAVKDSIMDWVFEWWHDEYNINIVRDSCDSMGLKINNYANVSSLDVSADIIGDSILIPYQVVSGYEILETDGYFQEDSIFFQIYYLTPNFGDPYIGFVQGIKTD